MPGAWEKGGGKITICKAAPRHALFVKSVVFVVVKRTYVIVTLLTCISFPPVSASMEAGRPRQLATDMDEHMCLLLHVRVLLLLLFIFVCSKMCSVEVRGQLEGVGCLSTVGGPRARTHVLWLDKCLYPLSHLAGAWYGVIHVFSQSLVTQWGKCYGRWEKWSFK